jgi:D-alanyl-D-alanine carboxypeptidase
MWQGIDAGPLFPPGTNWTYSNVNYILLTLIIDKAAGVPYEDYVTRNIFVPAGMNDTFIHRTNHIPGPHMECQEPGEKENSLKDYTDLYIQFDRGAGDIVSTAADLNRFHRALRTGKIMNGQSLASMQASAPQSLKVTQGSAGNVTTGYGLGYSSTSIPGADLTLYGHTGGYPGSYTILYYWVEKDTYISVNVNTMINGAAVNREILGPVLLYLGNRK